MTVTDSPWIRAGASIGANLVRGAVSVATGLVIARSLGATGFGDYAFLLGTFAALALLLDFGTTSAFYTMLARRPRGIRFFVVYVVWTVGVQFVATALVIGLALPDEALRKIWLGLDRPLVLLSLTASFVMTQVWTTVTQAAEALRKTLFIQGVATIQVLVHLILVLAAIHLDRLSITLLLALPIVEYLLLTVVLAPSLLRAHLRNEREGGGETFGSVVADYWRYCKPLVIYSIVGFAYQFADRWLLQHFGGGAQQGYFAIGLQFANIANLVTASILAVVWKEVAEAYERNDLERVRTIFERVRRGIFFFGAAVSAMLLPHVALLLRETVGAQYAGATLCVTLMFLYPIHQAIGQFQGTFLLATGETAAYSFVGIASMLVSIPIAYVVLASPSANPPGFGWGAVGLAAKMVVLQLIAVTVQFRALRRQHAFPWQWTYEILVVGSLAALSFATWVIAAWTGSVLRFSGSGILTALIAAVIYCAVVALAVARRPLLVGLTSMQRDAILRMARRFIARPA